MRYLVLCLLALVLVGCEVTTQQSVVLDPGVKLSLSPGDAAEFGIDRSLPAWMQQYCLEQIQQVAFLPARFERKRGPRVVMDPVHRTERFEGAKDVAACDLDYYVWPVVKDSFADLGIEYRYNAEVWGEFYEAINASVSAELADYRWEVVRVSEEATDEPGLSLKREIPREKLTEYLDVFYTKDEEVMFELVVVDRS